MTDTTLHTTIILIPDTIKSGRNVWDGYKETNDIGNELIFFVILAGALCFMMLGVLDAIDQTKNHKQK